MVGRPDLITENRYLVSVEIMRQFAQIEMILAKIPQKTNAKVLTLIY